METVTASGDDTADTAESVTVPPVVDGVTVAGNVCVIRGSVLAGTLVEAVVEAVVEVVLGTSEVTAVVEIDVGC